MLASNPLSPEKRTAMLERVAARLELCGPAFTDADVEAAIASAMVGLIHEPRGVRPAPVAHALFLPSAI
jgi:hypothetical protein